MYSFFNLGMGCSIGKWKKSSNKNTIMGSILLEVCECCGRTDLLELSTSERERETVYAIVSRFTSKDGCHAILGGL